MGGDSYDNVETPEWAGALMVSVGTGKGQTGTETGTAGAKKAVQRQPSLNCILKMNEIHQAAGGDGGEEGPQPGGQALPRIHARGGKSSLTAGCS